MALTIIPAIVAGLIIGIYEVMLIHRDVAIPLHRFGHSIHAVGIAIIATLINFNVPLFFQMVPAVSKIPVLGTVIGLRIAVGLVMIVKIHAASAATQNAPRGMQETWAHSLLIGALVVAVPYAWPFIAPMLPKWMR